MKSLHIRQLDEESLKGDKRRSRRNHRSLQKEVEALLQDAARIIAPDAAVTESLLVALKTVSTGRRMMEGSRDALYFD